MEKGIDMTDEKRCEPPEHLRGSDGEHFVCGPNGLPFVALWHAAPHAGFEPLWHNAPRTSTGTPAWAANEWGWRYLSPVTPPDVVRELVEALAECADDLEAEISARYSGVRHYECMVQDERRDMAPVEKARAMIAAAKEAGV
jgi:hypothetical protein